MRWVFFSLLFLNLVFAGWQTFQWYEHRTSKIIVPVDVQDTGVPGIVLLDEDRGSARLKSDLDNKRPKPARDADNSASREYYNETSGQAASTISAGHSGEAFINCLAFGPFDARQDSDKLKQYFDNNAIKSHALLENVTEPPVYWVYVRSNNLKEPAQSLIDDLRRAQIEAYLINEDGLPGGLSLGLFEKEAEAVSMIERLANLGIEANKLNKTNSYIDYWVVLDNQKSSNMDETLLNAIAEAFPRTPRGEKVCKPVAS